MLGLGLGAQEVSCSMQLIDTECDSEHVAVGEEAAFGTHVQSVFSQRAASDHGEAGQSAVQGSA